MTRPDKAALLSLRDRLRGATWISSPLFMDVALAALRPPSDGKVWDSLLALVYADAWTDASIALVERALPGWRWEVASMGKPGERFFEANVWAPNGWRDDGRFAFSAPTPSLALLLAMVEALIAEAGDATDGGDNG